MKFLSISFSFAQLPDPSQTFRLFPDFSTWRGPFQNYYFGVSLRSNWRLAKSLLHSLSRGVQRIQPRPSIQPIIKFIFSPHFVGFLETWDMRQRETPCCFSNFETKQKTGIFTRGIRILLDLELSWKIGISGLNQDEWQVCSSVASYRHFFPDKNSQLAGLRFFFSTKVKKKNPEFRINPEVAHSWVKTKGIEEGGAN